MNGDDNDRVVLTWRELRERINRARCSGIEEGYRLGLTAEPVERPDLNDEFEGEDDCGLTEGDDV